MNQDDMINDAKSYLHEDKNTLLELYLYLSYLVIILVCLFNSLVAKYIDERESKNEFLL